MRAGQGRSPPAVPAPSPPVLKHPRGAVMEGEDGCGVTAEPRQQVAGRPPGRWSQEAKPTGWEGATARLEGFLLPTPKEKDFDTGP